MPRERPRAGIGEVTSLRFMHRRTVLSWMIAVVVAFAAGMVVERYFFPVDRAPGRSRATVPSRARSRARGNVLRLSDASRCRFRQTRHLSDLRNGAGAGGQQDSVETRQWALTQQPVVRIAPEVVNNLGVKTAPVMRTTLMRRIDTPGFVQQIQPGQNRSASVRRSMREIAALHFKPDQWLEPGKPLVTLESEALRAPSRRICACCCSSAPMAAESGRCNVACRGTIASTENPPRWKSRAERLATPRAFRRGHPAAGTKTRGLRRS